MDGVSRPDSAQNWSWDARREVGETVFPKVPMRRGPLSGDLNFADLERGPRVEACVLLVLDPDYLK